jgi:hypothetical protein
MTDDEILTKDEAAAFLKISPRTLDRYREQAHLQEGIHWVALPGGELRFSKLLLHNWVMNQSDPEAHQRAIENWKALQLENRRRRRSPNRKGQAPSDDPAPRPNTTETTSPRCVP